MENAKGVFLIKTEVFSPIPVVSTADELLEMETFSFSSSVMLSLEVYRSWNHRIFWIGRDL